MKAHHLSQLFFLRLPDNRWSASLETQLRHSSPSGVLLDAPLPRSAESTSELLCRIALTLPQPSFLVLRQEGGTHDPLSRFLAPMPSPRAAGAKGLSAVARLGDLIGEALCLLGFNTDFAPLLDLATPFTAKTLGARTFSSDPHQVAECGGAFLRGLQRHKVLACGKHFPGWGSVPLENPHALPVSGKPMADLWREDLVPFRELLPQLPMTLIGNAAYKAYDFDHAQPASLSAPVVTGLLRVKLGFRGLALAYDLESPEVRGGPDFGEAVIAAMNAGCDLLVVNQEESMEVGCRALEAALETGKLLPQRIENAMRRIRVSQKGLRRPSGKLSARRFARLAHEFEEFGRLFRTGGEIEA